MAIYELKLPKMGESVAEATITGWLKQVGDHIELDDAVVEIATDKVDSDIPCEVEGVLIEQMFNEGDVVQVGQAFAIIETDEVIDQPISAVEDKVTPKKEDKVVINIENEIEEIIEEVSSAPKFITNSETSFFSPLVKKIAETEGLSQEELENINGSGLEGRITKDDVLNYVTDKKSGKKVNNALDTKDVKKERIKETTQKVVVNKVIQDLALDSGDELINLSRMGKIISDHMLTSKQKSAHVQSFIEVDVTNIVKWRANVKEEFLKREGEKLTYTPIFMMAVANAIKKYPLVNLAFDGVDQVIIKKAINIGMASALPDGNLIVPVIKDAANLNLVGMTKSVNSLANKSKNNALKPDDIKGGTYTVTNIGGFGSIFGTPIINQPESAILAIGAIRKVPAVIETTEGDFIGIRHKMYLSHSYDHRVINGALGGLFIKEIKDYLEAWAIDTQL